MKLYLETNSLRKLTDYSFDKCEVVTSIFSIFELLAGITEKDYHIRRSCLIRIKEQGVKIKIPMVDELFFKTVGESGYNHFSVPMITDIWHAACEIEDFNIFQRIRLYGTDDEGKKKKIDPLEWLRDWDIGISGIGKNIGNLFDNNQDYIRKIYNEKSYRGLAEYFFMLYYNNRLDENKLGHIEPFVDSQELNEIRFKCEHLFEQYNYRLFMTAQAVIFAKAFFINGGTAGRNDPSDLLHLLYLDRDDILISNDKIFETISKAIDDFHFIKMNNEKKLSELQIMKI